MDDITGSVMLKIIEGPGWVVTDMVNTYLQDGWVIKHITATERTIDDRSEIVYSFVMVKINDE